MSTLFWLITFRQVAEMCDPRVIDFAPPGYVLPRSNESLHARVVSQVERQGMPRAADRVRSRRTMDDQHSTVTQSAGTPQDRISPRNSGFSFQEQVQWTSQFPNSGRFSEQRVESEFCVGFRDSVNGLKLKQKSGQVLGSE